MKLDLTGAVHEIYNVVLRDVSAYGGMPFYGFVILIFLMLGNISFGARLFASLLVVTAVVAAARLAHFKERPGMKKKTYETIYERIDNSSFPSIHAARAVMITMALFSKINFLLPLMLLVILLICLSRIQFKRHDWVDITVGLIIGLALGFAFF